LVSSKPAPAASPHATAPTRNNPSWLGGRRGNAPASPAVPFPRPHIETPSMTRSPKPPPHAVRLSTYVELESYVRAFAAGHLHLFVPCGPHDGGKSRVVRRALNPNGRCISGQATPLGISLEAYEYRQLPWVLDDIAGLYTDRSGIRLLKALCQTEPVKTLGW